VFLEEMAARAARRVERSKEEIPARLLPVSSPQDPPPVSFRQAITRRGGEGLKLIAEVKRSSPSRGPIYPDLVVEDLVAIFERGGASAVSVLTEPEYFGGSLDDLTRACAATHLPVLRKDFILDPYQLLEAKAAGAGAALLIAAMLEGGELARLIAEAQALGLDALVEVHDEAELATALEAGAAVVGINNRDLRTLQVDLETTRKLAPMVPADKVLVSESGYAGNGQTAGLAALGVDAVLVGEALLRGGDPLRAMSGLRGDGHVPA